MPEIPDIEKAGFHGRTWGASYSCKFVFFVRLVPIFVKLHHGFRYQKEIAEGSVEVLDTAFYEGNMR